MLNKLTEDEIESSSGKTKYYELVDDFVSLEDDLEESGLAFFDENKKVTRMYRCDSKDETINTMKKVIAVCDLGEEEITKFNKVRTLIKRFLEVCFRKKFSVFALAMGFIFMFFMGIKERVYVICLMYTWGFFTITETSKALKILRESIEEYKLREEALVDSEFMEFFNTSLTDDIEDVMIYSLKKDKTM